MSHRWSFPSADRGSRRLFVLAAASWAAFLCAPSSLDAATALVRWRPGGVGAVTRYDLFVRDGGEPHAAAPAWSGNPPPATDGSLSAEVTYTPATSGVNYFAMVAVSGDQESALSRELPVGTPSPCRADTCSSETDCDFHIVADGTPCDDGAFCNGSETCQSGACTTTAARNCADTSPCTVDTCDEAANACTHVASPSCCPACDGSDPCLTDACAAGDCTADRGVEVEIDRLRFATGKSDVALSLKGRLATDAALAPTDTGAILELRTADGALLHWSAVAPEAFRAQASGGRYRFVAGRDADPSWNGLDRLGFRRKGPVWIVTAHLAAAALADAAREPSLTLVLRVGSTCARRLAAPCEQRSTLSICR